MSSTKLTEYQLEKLKPLEEKLKIAVRSGNPDEAIEIATMIQELFPYKSILSINNSIGF